MAFTSTLILTSHPAPGPSAELSLRKDLTPRHEDMRGSGGTAPQLLSLDTRCISYKPHATDTFLLEKKHPIPTAYEGGWAP
jgi:hypothetical protein